jgi:hypothetical protein
MPNYNSAPADADMQKENEYQLATVGRHLGQAAMRLDGLHSPGVSIAVVGEGDTPHLYTEVSAEDGLYGVSTDLEGKLLGVEHSTSKDDLQQLQGAEATDTALKVVNAANERFYPGPNAPQTPQQLRIR